MTMHTSSAEPKLLANYSQSMVERDMDLALVSTPLGQSLDAYATTCRWHAVPVGGLTEELRAHANKAIQFDVWVGTIAVGFWMADAHQAAVSAFQSGIFSFLDEHKGATEATTGLSTLLFLSGTMTLEMLQFATENRGVLRAGFKDFGRFLNALEGNARAGNVGKMDDIYRSLIVEGMPKGATIDKLLNSRLFGTALVVADAVFGTLEDLNEGTYGEDLTKTIGVNSLDAGMNWLISLNPYGLAALAINAGIQIGGNIGVGIDRVLADYVSFDDNSRDILLQTAQLKQDAYEQMDLGNITKQLSEGIYEGYSDYFSTSMEATDEFARAGKQLWEDPSFSNLLTVVRDLGSSEDVQSLAKQQAGIALLGPLAPLFTTKSGQKNLLETGEAVVNVVDGFVDLKISQVASIQNSTIAASTRLVDSLPVGDGFKSAVREWSTTRMEQNLDIAETLTVFFGFDR